jgi:hypothetical protein
MTIRAHDDTWQDETWEACPACGEPTDYCQGHGSIGDPGGAAILASHAEDDHTYCDPEACMTETFKIPVRYGRRAYTLATL